MTTEKKEHVFETAGLGKAPFHYHSFKRAVGPIQLADGMMIGSPGQPMGTCDYCGQGIADCYTVKSSDGNTFMVGSTCIHKTGDAGLKRMVNKEKAKQKKEKDLARIATAKDLLESGKVDTTLRAKYHPSPALSERGASLLDYVWWMMENAGTTGRVKATRLIEKAAKETENV